MGACSIVECDRPIRVTSRGWCALHYQRWQRHGDPEKVIVKVRRVGVEPCWIDGCEKPMSARNWCIAHWTRWKRHGSPTARLRGEVLDGKRICSRCRVDKALDMFSSGESRCRRCVADIANERRAPWVPVEGTPRECRNCQSVFMANGRRSRYCRDECYETDKNRANWKHLVARRARIADAWVETFDRFEIFERDGWVCQICLIEINPDLKHPDPGSASLDHIVPVSRGGEHSRANAQASHFYCNTVKGASLPEAVA